MVKGLLSEIPEIITPIVFRGDFKPPSLFSLKARPHIETELNYPVLRP